jgi:hypothetical protein
MNTIEQLNEHPPLCKEDQDIPREPRYPPLCKEGLGEIFFIPSPQNNTPSPLRERVGVLRMDALMSREHMDVRSDEGKTIKI